MTAVGRPAGVDGNRAAGRHTRGAWRRSSPARHGCAARRSRAETGSVTAELALGLPAVVLALVLVMLVASAAIAQVQCADAARAAARAAALGEDSAAVAQIATELAGVDASADVAVTDGWVQVTVSRPVGTGWLGTSSLTASASATVPIEPGSGP